MTQEEKAKRYDEAIEKGKQIQNTPYTAHWDIMKEVAEHLLPELKESEDERIRKEIISAIKEDWPGHKDWIAWLEKHGEQKPTDKIEPKFKIGDWVIDKQGIVHQIAKVIENVTYHTYVVYDIAGVVYFNDNTEGVRPWTIQDAKNGDVLVHNNCVFIFIGIKNGIVQAIEENFLKPVSFGEPDKDKDYYPATKEQRDLLLQKIKKAGYEWNADKKELKKVEQKPVECVWSEEDESILKELIRFIPKHLTSYSYNQYYNWAVSHKPQKQWKPSEEQIKVCKEVYADILSAKGFDVCTVNSELNRLEEQLKKLREE